MESSENIDRYFKEKLENYKESPPQDTWDKIALRLGHSRKRRMVIFISRIAAGITILVSLSVLFHYIQKDKNVELAHQSDSLTEIKPGNIDNALIVGRETSPEKNGLSATAVAAKTIVDKPSHPGTSNNQYHKQAIPPEQKSEPDVLQTGSDVEYMASDYVSSVADKISYLVPVDCNHLDSDDSGYDLIMTTRNDSKIEQLYELSVNQLFALNDEQSDKKERQTEWLLGGQFAPLYSYRSLESEQYQDYVKSQINSRENGIIAYAGGVNLTVSPSRRFSVQSGIYYSKYGQEKNSLEYLDLARIGPVDPNRNTTADFYAMGDTKSEEGILSVYIGNSTGKIIAGNEGQINANQSPWSNMIFEQTESNQLNSTMPVKSITQYFEYLEIPVNLKYKVLDKKFDVSLMGGISTNFLIGTENVITFFGT